jgi:hypothetical protein
MLIERETMKIIKGIVSCKDCPIRYKGCRVFESCSLDQLEHLEKTNTILPDCPLPDSPVEISREQVQKKAPESKYDEMLEKYLTEGINWDAFRNVVIITANKGKKERGDVEQFAADSYWQGWQDANSDNGKLSIPLPEPPKEEK